MQLWARGQVWWTNVGYWPYGAQGRDDAESWTGSNAPHLSDEPANSARQSDLLGYAWLTELAALDLERAGPGNFKVRRQLIHIKPDLWIVVDFVSGAQSAGSTTLWTTSHDVELIDLDVSGGFLLRGQSGNEVLSTFIFGSEGVTIDRRTEAFLHSVVGKSFNTSQFRHLPSSWSNRRTGRGLSQSGSFKIPIPPA